MKKSLLLLVSTLLGAAALVAQSASDIVVPITVTTTNNPASITLAFPAVTGATATFVGRKLVNETAWSVLSLPANATTFTDNSVIAGIGFEYIVVKATSVVPTQRIGLVYAGIEVLPNTYRGKTILVVDNTLSAPLAVELDRYVQDLRGDGWQVLRHDIDVATSTVPSVKALLRADYESDSTSIVSALLFGNIPVPYSGLIAPDGHTPDHLGAWPTDYYYGDMNETVWTDNTVNNIGAARAANRNVPGDGKFDQSLTQTLPELVVSRVDFSNLTTGWGMSQTELYRRYLNKNHAFRTGAYKPDNKTIVDDNFGYFGGEAFSQNGYRNGYALTGPNSVQQGDFITNTKNQSFLFGHGCGPGSYTSANGVGNSANFQSDSVNVVFSMLFGSYFGDWDSENNPFMPSALASKGGILTCSWAGRPNWHYHHMGLGEPISTSAYWVWLNSFLGNARVYPPSSSDELIHVGLLGDPTLRAHAVRPAQNLVATASCETIGLSWTASPDAQLGHLVYWAPHPDSAYIIIGGTQAPGTTYVDSFPVDGENYYQVKAFKLETVPTGSYYNQSIGIGSSAMFGTDPFTAEANVNHVSCNGAGDGAILLIINGGSGLTYMWSTGATTADLSDLDAGTYTVTITDMQGCSAVVEGTIDEPEELGIGAMVTNVSCFGRSDGSMAIDVNGGVLPYSYEWSTGSTDQNLSGLAAGTYTATVTDGNGCLGISTDEVTQPTVLQLSLTAANADCNGASTGGILSTTSGGTPSYDFAWSTGDTGEHLVGVPAGTYTLTLTDSNGCTQSASSSVGEPSAIIASATTTAAGCAGATNGSISVMVSGGNPGYMYSWSNGPSTPNQSNVASGTYTLTITDGSGCASTISATVGQNSTLMTSATATPADCFGEPTGSASAQASGGTPGYTFRWSNGAMAAAISDLFPSTYTVTVTDNVGCTQATTVVVAQPAQLLAGGVWTALPCSTTVGTVVLTVSGGTPGYMYLWSNNMTTKNLENIAPGVYTVTATDANGCTVVSSNLVVQPPAPLKLISDFEQNSCPGVMPVLGNLYLEVTGGTGGYTFLWSNGSTDQILLDVPAGPYTVTVTDGAGCTAVRENTLFFYIQPWNTSTSVTSVSCNGGNNGSVALSVAGSVGPMYTYLWSNNATVKNLNNVPAGIYTVTITDEIGCTRTETALVGQPDVLAASVNTSAPVTCPGRSDGQASMIVGGGTPGYTYLWSNGGTGLQDANLPAGQNSFTATDASGCKTTATVTIDEPTPPVVSIAGADTACVGGTILYSLPGTLAGFQWMVSANGTISQGQGAAQVEVIWQTPGAGTVSADYTWSANNCPDDASRNVAVKVCVGTEEPTLPGVRVLPNPFGAHLSVVFDRPVQPGSRLRLLDAHGKLLVEQTVLSEISRLETNHLPAGTYVLQVIENGAVGVWKVVKIE
ncbi:MAG: T9SS type A sorting domain-containing protein [Saprospiraceae bacterium]